MPITDIPPLFAYDPDAWPNPVTDFYAPALLQSVTYNCSTFTSTAVAS